MVQNVGGIIERHASIVVFPEVHQRRRCIAMAYHFVENLAAVQREVDLSLEFFLQQIKWGCGRAMSVWQVLHAFQIKQLAKFALQEQTFA